MKLIIKLLIYFVVFQISLCINETKYSKRNSKNDYYNSYDYNSLNIDNETIDINSLIVPVPEHFNSIYGVEAPDFELPDDSLADTDLKDHDFIDNLMYVYFGTNKKDSINYGLEIIIIGSALSCIIELVTIICAFLRKNRILDIQKDAKLMFMHWMGCSFFSNLIFMFNTYVTKGSLQCGLISFTLFYLHIVTTCSLFTYTLWIGKVLYNKNSNLKSLLVAIHVFAIILYLISLLLSPRINYETQRFCYLSIQRGTIIEYILPICVLILATTFFSLNGIRKINTELSNLGCDYPDCQIKYIEHGKCDATKENRIYILKEFKKLLKVLCVIQCFYETVWFTSVLALENLPESNVAAVAYSVASFVLNFYIFWKFKLFLPVEDQCLYYDGIKETEKIVGIISDALLADDIPLLIDSESIIDIAEFKTEYIRAISN